MGHDVILLGGVPPHPYGSLPHMLAGELKRGRAVQDYKFPINQSSSVDIDERLRMIAQRHSAVYVPVLQIVCGGKRLCRGYANGHSIYFDNNHPTVATTRNIVKKLILPLLAETAGQPATGQLGVSRSE